VRVVEEVNSPNVKLLYDIYHMQIMEGDLIDTIRQNVQWIGHFHTGGVPGRHELDDTQEIQWVAVMRAVADAGFTGSVAHEFVPLAAPLVSLRKAADLCDVSTGAPFRRLCRTGSRAMRAIGSGQNRQIV